jgi:peptidoglycan/LPS O-acetylase OafA/YrhL|tara:strand:- start:11520 stop:11873 length:354 start_codon:yes stop_codon:yes gene_type:complete
MICTQLQRVHEEHGRVKFMAAVSRRILPLAALCTVVVAVTGNLFSGGSTLIVALSGISVIFIVFTWYLFEATSRQEKAASSPTSPGYSTGTKVEQISRQEDSELPDPLEAGFEIPLM